MAYLHQNGYRFLLEKLMEMRVNWRFFFSFKTVTPEPEGGSSEPHSKKSEVLSNTEPTPEASTKAGMSYKLTMISVPIETRY